MSTIKVVRSGVRRFGLKMAGLTALGTLAVATPARGAATIIDDGRIANTAVWIHHDWNGNEWQDEWDSYNYPNILAQAFNISEVTPVIQSSSGVGSGQASVMQSSSLSGSSTFSSLTAHGSATGHAALGSIDPTVVTANAYGWSVFQIDFLVAEPQDWTISGSIQRSNPVSNNSLAEITLSEVGGSTLYSASQIGSFGYAGTLDPGTYRLHCVALANEVIGEGMSSDNSASFSNVNFTLVPEPGCILLLGLGALLELRRRAQQR